MAIERMNYFKGEFLHVEDFRCEQKYHLDMRRRHNQYLHTSGIADGLQVTAGVGKVTIAKGIAIDRNGKEIILEEPKDVTISSVGVIGIKYKEEEDPASNNEDTTFPGKKRIQEGYEVTLSSDPEAIVLAKVINVSPVTLDPNFKPVYSGPTVMGDLVIEGDLTVKGTSTTVNTETVEVKDNIIRVNKYAPQATPKNVNGGLEVYRGGTSPNAQIIWDENVDKWRIGVVGSLSDIAYGPNADKLLNNSVAEGLHTHGSLSTPAGSHALSVDAAGNVGIGTVTPGNYKLNIGSPGGDNTLFYNALFIASDCGLRGKNKLNLIKFGNDGDYQVLHKAAGAFERNTLSIHCHEDDAFGIYSTNWTPLLEVKGGSGDVYVKGNLGVGTANPQDKLDIAGGLRVLNGSNPIRFTSVWSGFPDAVTNQAEISNDTGTFKTLMIIGNKSAGMGRRVSVWDRLEVNGTFITTGNVGIGITNPTSKLTVAGSIAGGETKTGWVLGKGAWGTDNWLRLTTSQGGDTYHDLAVNAFWAAGAKRYDLAEVTPVKEEDNLESGDVVVIDKDNGLRVMRSIRPYDTSVYGIVSSYDQASMVIGGEGPESATNATDRLPVALIGRVRAKVSTENGSIQAGDLLTTSAMPGYLMKCTDISKYAGAIAGKALEPLASGKGMITIFVSLQ